MMIKQLSSLLVLGSLWIAGIAGYRVTAGLHVTDGCLPTPVATGDSTRLENSLLWRITHPDFAGDSYLFGTIHIITPEEYFLPAGTEGALEKADRVVFEIDMREMMDLGAQLSMIMKAFMKDGIRLRDLVSAEDYKLIEKHFAGIGLPMVLLERIKPMFLTVFASQEISPGDLSSGDMKSYEMEFYDFAVKHQKPTGGLETIDFQLSMFDSIPYTAQAQMLVESIRAEEEQNDLFQQMIELYRQQDIEALYLAIGEDSEGAGAYEDILVTHRNKRWIAGMQTYMREGSVFFAVGAGHLGGPHGVIRLLRAAGYQVTPVTSDDVRPLRKF
jgi:uncharacterized protein